MHDVAAGADPIHSHPARHVLGQPGHGDDAAPGDHAGELRPVGAEQPLTNDRVHSVGADQGIAAEKGRTAAETRRSTANWQERVQKRPEMLRMPNVTPVQGGLPIVVDGTCVGGVGVSGVQSHEDEQIAAAGIKALG